jgi:hypothetical protein
MERVGFEESDSVYSFRSFHLCSFRSYVSFNSSAKNKVQPSSFPMIPRKHLCCACREVLYARLERERERERENKMKERERRNAVASPKYFQKR